MAVKASILVAKKKGGSFGCVNRHKCCERRFPSKGCKKQWSCCQKALDLDKEVSDSGCYVRCAECKKHPNQEGCKDQCVICGSLRGEKATNCSSVAHDFKKNTKVPKQRKQNM